MAELLIQISKDDKDLIEPIRESLGVDAGYLDTKRLNGGEIVQLIIENAGKHIDIIAALIALFRNRKADLSFILPGGKKIVNPTDDELNTITSGSE
jgi:hypothetical protein